MQAPISFHLLSMSFTPSYFAQGSFGENIELDITGNVKDAQAFARQLANEDAAMSTNLVNSKLEDDAPENNSDVILHINDDEASDMNSAKLITLKFEFLIKLNIVCVGVEDSEEVPQNNILCNLFPDDTGLELPQQSAKLRIGNSLSFDESRTSRPYKWAQHLAGIDCLPEVSPLVSVSEESSSETTKHASALSGLSLYRQQNRVQTVVQRIRTRKKAQLAPV
ncbi:UNVERIFIED_CONTAM: THO complex subunitB [Sesamum radiatum]|uniref:THO complex subunitB n=1 Tax=Sesamum radiatum TaxID=300843 RepID=A0AAW2SK34_SESRA